MLHDLGEDHDIKRGGRKGQWLAVNIEPVPLKPQSLAKQVQGLSVDVHSNDFVAMAVVLREVARTATNIEHSPPPPNQADERVLALLVSIEVVILSPAVVLFIKLSNLLFNCAVVRHGWSGPASGRAHNAGAAVDASRP